LFTPSQIRAARALVGWSQTKVATAARLSIPTIKRAEADGGIRVSDDAVIAIACALKKAGVEFIAENGGGPGVRLREPQRSVSTKTKQQQNTTKKNRA
jgi:transcriptional regulator with XRE-family HTH domain